MPTISVTNVDLLEPVTTGETPLDGLDGFVPLSSLESDHTELATEDFTDTRLYRASVIARETQVNAVTTVPADLDRCLQDIAAHRAARRMFAEIVPAVPEAHDETKPLETELYSYNTNVLAILGMGSLNTPARKKQRPLLGLEIELEVNLNLSRDWAVHDLTCLMQKYAICKSDSSLEYGLEIVTVPRTLDEHREWWIQHHPEFIRIRDKYKLQPSGRCGLHVNIDRCYSTPYQVGKMLVFLHCTENRGFVRLLARRAAKKWGEYHSQKKLTSGKESANRYTALNLHHEERLELRIFRSTTRLDRLLIAMEFAHALYLFCAPAETSAAALTVKSFVQWCSSPPYRRAYSNLLTLCSNNLSLTEKEAKPCA